MKYSCKIANNTLEVTFPKQLTFIVCEDIEEELFEKVKQVEYVLFNLEEVEYISSEFVKVCAKMLKLLGRKNFTVSNIGEFPEFVFQTSGLKRILMTK
jgi:anti-anti-sigma regulatory factor